MADPELAALTALRRLRHVETDAARRDLGDALTRETVLTDQDAGLRTEIDAARQFPGEFDRDAFIAWFGRKRAERAQLADALRDAEARTTTARTVLAQRRVAETSAEEALAAAIASRDADAAHREQIMLEDVSRTLRRMPGRDPGKRFD